MPDRVVANDDTIRLTMPTGARVLVVGDIILDSYVHGKVDRISPESPVPIVEVTVEEHRLGGAANVAANIVSLGGVCDLIGVVGDDQAGTVLRGLLTDTGIADSYLVTDTCRPTTQKTRVLSRNQQIVRIDRETRTALGSTAREATLARLAERIPYADAVVIQDYDKGVLDPQIIAAARDLSTRRGIAVVVDPKAENFWQYKGVTCVTPNVDEAAAAAGCRIGTLDDLRDTAGHLLRELELDTVLITRGAEGLSLFEREGTSVRATHVPAVAREVYDVTGAGDTVVAAYTLGLAGGMSPRSAARCANYAGGIVVGKLGCVPVDRRHLLQVIADRAAADAADVVREDADLPLQ